MLFSSVNEIQECLFLHENFDIKLQHSTYLMEFFIAKEKEICYTTCMLYSANNLQIFQYKSTLVMSAKSFVTPRKTKTYKHLRQQKHLNAIAAKKVLRRGLTQHQRS